MSELSRLLGDVYGGTALDESEGPPPQPASEEGIEGQVEAGAQMPDWADEKALDAAFASWVPGPPADAPAAEHAAMAGGGSMVSAPSPRSTVTEAETTTDAATPEGAPNQREGDDSWLFGLAETAQDRPSHEVTEVAEIADFADEPVASPEPVAPSRAAGLPWSRTHDDILPRRSGGFRLRLR